jgi:hypothetical protein
MEDMMKRRERTRSTARLLLAAVALTTIGGCMSVHPRVWQNGEAMSTSRAYQQMLLGDYSFKNQRALYSSATPLRAWHNDAPYTPFGRW